MSRWTAWHLAAHLPMLIMLAFTAICALTKTSTGIWGIGLILVAFAFSIFAIIKRALTEVQDGQAHE